MVTDDRVIGFEPFVPNDSWVLILGSFPSVRSRQNSFYYGNPQNRFWGILADAFDEPVPLTLQEKKNLLTCHHIALWDIVAECNIRGSMDADIRNPVIADIESLLQHTNISHIITNGKTAHDLTVKNFPTLKDKIIPLSSTSPANTRLNRNQWIDVIQDLCKV